MLEGRVEILTQFEDKFKELTEEVKNRRKEIDELKSRVMQEISKTNLMHSEFKVKVEKHIREYKVTF